MILNWTTIVTSAITAAVNGAAMFLSVRYVGKIADTIEKKRGKEREDNDKTTAKI